MPVAFTSYQRDLAPLGHVLAFSHDIEPLLADSGGPGRPEIGKRDAMLAYEFRPGGGGDESGLTVPSTLQQEPTESAAVGEVAEPGVDDRGSDEQAGPQHGQGLGQIA